MVALVTLATVAPERGPLGEGWEYIGTNYLLLGVIIEQVTGRSVAEVLRSGVLDRDGFERLIYQPDERPTDPMAMPSGAPAKTFEENGGYLPSHANATMFTSEGAMASDAPTLARWFRALCAGQIVSPASLDEMTDFDERPEYGLGVWDRWPEYGGASGALGHTAWRGRGTGPRHCASRILASLSWCWRTKKRRRRRLGRRRPGARRQHVTLERLAI